MQLTSNNSSLKKGEINANVTMSLQVALNAARQWQLVAILAFVFAACLIVVILVMLPLKEVQVRYVEFLGSRDIHYNMHPARISKKQKQLLVNKALRNFVTYAHTSDRITAKKRFAEIKAMSSSGVYGQMRNWYGNLQDHLGKSGTRDVSITYSQPITDSIYEVEFETIDNIINKTIKKTWIAKLSYRVNNSKTIISEQAVYNPLGIEILKYHVSERKKDE